MKIMRIIFFLICTSDFYFALDTVDYDTVRICFPDRGPYSNYYPPLEEPPNAEDIVYSVSNRQIISRPIVAYLCTSNRLHIPSSHYLYSSETNPVYFDVASIPTYDSIHQWIITEDENFVRFCQYAANNISIWDPRRLEINPKYFRPYLLITEKLYLPSIRVMGSYLLLQGIYHDIKVTTNTKFFQRQFEFSVKYKNKVITVTTNPVKVYTHTARLNWLLQPDESDIIANHPFNISLEITDGINRIETGLDSTLIVEVTLTYVVKHFLMEKMADGFLYDTNFYLTGDEVITSNRNYDRVIHKRAVKGLVEINNVIIQEQQTAVELKFNATLIVPRIGLRQPNKYTDLSKWCREEEISKENLKIYTMNAICEMVQGNEGVKFSRSFLIREQIPDNLVLVKQSLYKNVLEEEIPEEIEEIDKFSLTVTSNLEVLGIWIILVDSDKRRVFSGKSSNLEIEIEVKSSKENICSSIPLLRLNRGAAKFHGWICEAVENVSFTFRTTTHFGKKISVQLPKLVNVLGDINIALYGRFNTAGHRDDTDPLVETFAKFATKHLNAGMYSDQFPLQQNKGLKYHLKVYDSQENIHVATDYFATMMDESEENPSKEIFGIIGFGDNIITQRMRAILKLYKLPVVTYRETWKEFRQKERYMTMTGISWDKLSIITLLGDYFIKRGWTQIIIMADEFFDSEFSLSSSLKKFKIQVLLHVIMRINQNKKYITEAMSLVKTIKTRIILLLVHAPLQQVVLREAINHNISCLDGYQWIALGPPAQQFDWKNSHPECAKKPTCTEAFQGMILLEPAYNLTGMQFHIWYRLNREFYEMNPAQYSGIPTSRDYPVLGQIAVGYDAVITFAYKFEQFLEKTFAKSKRDVHFKHDYSFLGLTGKIKFEETSGQRIGSMMCIRNVVAEPFSKRSPLLNISPMRWLVMEDTYSENLLKVQRKKRQAKNTKKHEWIVEMPVEGHKGINSTTPYSTFILPKKAVFVLRFVFSTKQYIYRSISFKPHRNETDDLSDVCLRTVPAIVPYSCEKGCGGVRLHSWNAVQYSHGTCVNRDECRCLTVGEYYKNMSRKNFDKPGFTGRFCQDIVCDVCFNGHCNEPYNCACNSGYGGYHCNISVCAQGCVHGDCILPNYCTCHVGYYGQSCQSLLGATILLILFFLFLVLLVIYLYCFLKRKKEKEKIILQNLDWLVDWKDVKKKAVIYSPLLSPFTPGTTVNMSPRGDSNINILSAPSNSKGRSTAFGYSAASYFENTVEWKKMNCYVQKFARDSLDINSVDIRMEIIQLKEMKHPNLVLFIGACLTAPNVALLVEIVPKGSLSDIFQNDKFNLTWSFKFSILRDIASGMEYIHNSKIGSHGRLKSTNCLIDNRLTCKISGFGVQSMRKVANTEGEDFEDFQRSILWTAPEILQVSTTPNDVGKGTKAGDVYSFGIIITEMCTHNLPFYKELHFVSIEELLRVLKNFHNPANRGIKKLLEMSNYDISKPIRPALLDKYLPTVYLEKRGIQKMIFETTTEDPNQRPNFKDILQMIDIIYPLKGELIENLMTMLEKYTNHLEDLLHDKMTKIQLQKNKTEDLIKRLLPPTIAEKLKLNNTVPPEMHFDVTILFSDIVGFTSIAKELEPIEVVELLNDLYTSFDSIIESFNVYKLETIGDAYCIVSGVPTPCHNHYEEIATMALHLLSAVETFPLRNSRKKKLQIRIGIHSGMCVSGVVGVKMPRYCIFGEDVIIAAHMESYGRPDTIQVSSTTANLLERTDNYYLAYRSELEIKFVGNIETYWLIGKKGFDKNLPWKSPIMTPTSTQESTLDNFNIAKTSLSSDPWKTIISSDPRKTSVSTNSWKISSVEEQSHEDLNKEWAQDIEEQEDDNGKISSDKFITPLTAISEVSEEDDEFETSWTALSEMSEENEWVKNKMS